jgi:hypothetical protein
MGWEDWDFWLRAAAHGFRFVQLQEVGFDYRVRTESMLSTTKKHAPELLEYMFSKPELQYCRLFRQLDAQLRYFESSRAYKVGRVLASCWSMFRPKR